MKQVFTPNRRVFIHDFDGVHYANADFPDMHPFLARAKAEAAAILLPDISYEQAVTMGLTSWYQTGNGQYLFVEHAKNLGMDVAAFQRDFHFLMHKIAGEKLLAESANKFLPDPIINDHFESLRGVVRHGLLTQSCITNWSGPLLSAMNRLQYFEENVRFGYAESGFKIKSESTQPLERAIAAMNAKPDEVVFIEDTLRNLEKAKELDERILTVLTYHGKPEENLPDYIDLQTPTLATLFTHAKNIYRGMTPQQNNSLVPGSI